MRWIFWKIHKYVDSLHTTISYCHILSLLCTYRMMYKIYNFKSSTARRLENYLRVLLLLFKHSTPRNKISVRHCNCLFSYIYSLKTFISSVLGSFLLFVIIKMYIVGKCYFTLHRLYSFSLLPLKLIWKII